jgi:polyisoprenoid-binding protein YceI
MIGRVARFVVAAVIIPTIALAQGPVHLVVAPSGNEARFVVREKLMMNTVDNDAIGVTTAIAGTINLDAKGKVDPATSMFTIQLDSLKTDQSRRDHFFKSNTLETTRFPTAILAIKEIQGLPARLPTSGTMNLSIVGDFTVHGVTKSSIWTTVVTADPTGFTGTATTHVKFEDFNMTQPSVPVLARLDDDIKLEYAFHFVKK